MHVAKRFYLLGSLIISLLIPLITFTHYVEVSPQPFMEYTFNTVPANVNSELKQLSLENTSSNYWNIQQLLVFIYCLGVVLCSVRFVINLFHLYRRITKYDKHFSRSFIYVLLNKRLVPHSFFKYIFLNKSDFNNNTIPQEVLLHEETHAKQLHSLDILILEVLQVFLWFHPFIYIIKYHIKLNHEFLADHEVLKHGTSIKNYQNIILQFSSSTQTHQMASAINYSSIKKRITIMKTRTSKKQMGLITLLMIPIVSILIYGFSQNNYVAVPIKPEDISQNDIVITETGATEAQISEYNEFLEDYKKTNIIILDKYDRARIIYDQLMTTAQRSTVEKYPEPILPNFQLSNIDPRPITKTKFEALKDKSEYAVWVDGNSIKNSDLEQYSHEDFVHYTSSRVLKNARSERFPQPYQLNLYTEKGFYESFDLSLVKKYRAAAKKYTQALKIFLTGPREDNSELKILKAQADKIYSLFDLAEIKQYDIKMPPPIPAVRSSKNRLKNSQNDQNNNIEESSKSTKRNLTKLSELNTSEHTARSISIEILNNNTYLINGKESQKKNLESKVKELHTDISPATRKRIMNIHLTSKNEISNEEIWYVYNSLLDYGFHRLVTKDQEIVLSKGNTPFNTEKSVPYKTGTITINDQILYYVQTDRGTNYYNRWGQKVDKSGSIINANQTQATDVIEGQVISKVYKDDEVIVEFDSGAIEKEFSSKIRKSIIYISVSEDGKYAIAEDETLSSFSAISLDQIKEKLSSFDSEELNNTFIFGSARDLKKYRSKPSDTPEYFDDIEIYLIRENSNTSSIRKSVENSAKDIGLKGSYFELALDNGNDLKPAVNKLLEVFKKFKGINMTN